MSYKGGDAKDGVPRRSVDAGVRMLDFPAMVSDTVDQLERLVPESTVPRVGVHEWGPLWLGDGQSCTRASAVR